MKEVVRIVATHMDAVDPETGIKTSYVDDPDSFIDLVMIPYNKTDAKVTTPLLVTIVSYGWVDRMRNIKKRVKRITRELRANTFGGVPQGEEVLSVTFLAKEPGAWHSA